MKLTTIMADRAGQAVVRSQTPKLAPPFHSTEALAISAPPEVPVVVAITWLVCHGPSIVPLVTLYVVSAQLVNAAVLTSAGGAEITPPNCEPTSAPICADLAAEPLAGGLPGDAQSSGDPVPASPVRTGERAGRNTAGINGQGRADLAER